MFFSLNPMILQQRRRLHIYPVLIFKVLVLQKLHGLSDEELWLKMEDRFSVMIFL
jgi:hypothetical protein